MKNLIAVILLCLVFIACSEKTSVKYVEDIKEEVSLNPMLMADHIDFNGTQIPIRKFRKILPYNDKALVFVDFREKLLYITDIHLKVNKFIDLKEKYDSLFRPAFNNAFILKDTLFMGSDLYKLHKMILPNEKLCTITFNTSWASPYNIYFRNNGNYVITFWGISMDKYLSSFSKFYRLNVINKETILELKKMNDSFAGRDFIVGAEVTPAGGLVRIIRTDKDYYDHDFGGNDDVYYFENLDKQYLYFKMSKNIIVFDEKGNAISKQEIPVKKEWTKPHKTELGLPTFYCLNDQPAVKYLNYLIQEAIPSPLFKTEQQIVYNSDFSPEFRMVLNGLKEKSGYSSLISGSKLILYSTWTDDKNLYIFDMEKLNWRR